jgi:exopolysaccharide biosynthesis polyprenyl glycosylphosphotransferase
MSTQHRTGIKAAPRSIVDALLVYGGFTFGWWLHHTTGMLGGERVAPLTNGSSLRVALVAITLLVFSVTGIYRKAHGRSMPAEVRAVVRGVVTALGLLVIACFIANITIESRLALGYAGISITLFLIVARVLQRHLERVFWRRGIGVQRVLVVGDGITAQMIMRDLLVAPANGQQLSGCLAHYTQRSGRSLLVDAGRLAIVPVHGSIDDLDRAIIQQHVDQVIIALPVADDAAVQHIVRTCAHHNVQVYLAPEMYGLAAQHLAVETRYRRSLLTIRDAELRRRRIAVKRALDIGLSLLVLVPFGLLLTLIVAVLIKLDSRGPVFFRQKRLTRMGNIFSVYKFRTMVVNADQLKAQLMDQNEASGPIFKMRHDPRLTRVGRWLRRTSLDELPQVFNILHGDMSWVGPRPPLPSEVAQYEEWQRRRLGTTAGLTGLWQVSGRSLLPFGDMVKLDLYYIENWSIWLDLQILLRTIPAVLLARGAF